MTADQAFDLFIDECQEPTRRHRKVLRERYRELPVHVVLERARVEAYDLKTEQLLRWLHGGAV